MFGTVPTSINSHGETIITIIGHASSGDDDDELDPIPELELKEELDDGGGAELDDELDEEMPGSTYGRYSLELDELEELSELDELDENVTCDNE